MRKIGILLISLTLIGLSCKQQVEQPNTLSPLEEAEGWTLLFDGESIDQWRSYLKDELTGWIVEDGNMKALGMGGDKGGDIITLREYENFKLSLEWKISTGGNSGILFMVHEDTAYHQVYHTGPEFQLLDDLGWEGSLEDWQKTGANYAMHIANAPDLKTAGEWNTAILIKDGAHVEHWLNGKKIVEYELWSEDWNSRVKSGKWKNFPSYGQFRKGHISLQDHGSETWFRSIKVKEL